MTRQRPLPHSGDSCFNSCSGIDGSQNFIDGRSGTAVHALRRLWSVVIPTFRRQDVLSGCLAGLAEAVQQIEQCEVIVLDNGTPDLSREVVAEFSDRLPLEYHENAFGHGLGYSLSRGVGLARGDFVLEVNDDAIVPPDLLIALQRVFDSDPAIGVVGVRAIEEGYAAAGDGIGQIDPDTCQVIGNFHLPTDEPIDVDHVYGFCYAYRRELLDRGAGHDQVLLARDYSSGNRIETDHCLMAKKLGYRVVYDGRIAVQHLAKPRPDMSERSHRWRLNHTRNTFYLLLKHYGWSGNRAIAPRFCLKDIGIRSAILRPSWANWAYVATGLRARISAVWHWLKYLARKPKLYPRPGPLPENTTTAAVVITRN